MSRGLRAATYLVRTWVRLYTLGVPVEHRVERRLEIEADLWEQGRAGEASGGPGPITALEVLLRALLGAFDDLSWRFEVVRARRGESLLERRGTVMNLSARHIRWLGLAGLMGGILWAADLAYFVRNDPTNALRAWGWIPLSMLFIAGLAGFWAQQREGAARVGQVGFGLLLVAFGSWFLLNFLGGAFGVSGGTLLMNILALAFVFLTPPGFLLLGFGLRGPVRRVPLVIGVILVAAMLLPSDLRARGDSLLNLSAFFVAAVGIAWMGYSAFRSAGPDKREVRSPEPSSSLSSP